MKNNVMVSLQHIAKSFETQDEPLSVLRDITIDICDNEFICIVGYSGCGKSTLLRIIAALEKPDSGSVSIAGRLHTQPNRDAILLFQDFNQLFPWKTILQNIVHPLRATGKIKDKEKAREKALSLLDTVGLKDYTSYYPHQLSGGMKQRAAVARALSLEPKVLLMDEPFAALDDVTRRQLRQMVRDVCLKQGVTTLFVTHNIEEAITMGNRIVTMDRKTGSIKHIHVNDAYTDPDNKLKRFELCSRILDDMENQ